MIYSSLGSPRLFRREPTEAASESAGGSADTEAPGAGAGVAGDSTTANV